MASHDPLKLGDLLPPRVGEGTDRSGQPRRSLYYGWVLMVVLGITTIISYGTTQYLFGVLVVPLDATFHWGRASISGAYALGLIEVDARFEELVQERGLAQNLQRWSKDKHLERMRDSAHFRFTREVLLHHSEQGDAARFIELILTNAYSHQFKLQTITAHEIDFDRLKQAALQHIGSDPVPWYVSYRVRSTLLLREVLEWPASEVATWLSTHIFIPGRQRRLLPRHANGNPAFGLYQREAEADVYQLFGLVVLGMEGEQIASLVGFLELSSLSSFALPGAVCRDVDHFRDCSSGDRLPLAHPDGTVLAKGCGSGFGRQHADGKGCGQP